MMFTAPFTSAADSGYGRRYGLLSVPPQFYFQPEDLTLSRHWVKTFSNQPSRTGSPNPKALTFFHSPIGFSTGFLQEYNYF